MPEVPDPQVIRDIAIPDYESNKIDIYPNINDVPTAPSETQGSNISHIHDEHNKLVDSVITGNNELRKAIQYNYNYIGDTQSQLNDLYYYAYEGYNRATSNQVTITNNRIYHDGVTNILRSDLTALLQRIETLENEVFKEVSLFVFDNIESFDGEIYLTIPSTGNLVEILINNVTNQFDVFFEYDGNVLTTAFDSSNEDGYNYDYSPDAPISVLQNTDLLITTGGIDDLEITNIRLKIIPTVNNNEFIIDNVSLTNDGVYESYFITVPKSGELTQIAFDNVAQLSGLNFIYDLEDKTGTTDNLSDPNFPYAVNFAPPFNVVKDESIRVYTSTQEPNLTKIRLTIL